VYRIPDRESPWKIVPAIFAFTLIIGVLLFFVINNRTDIPRADRVSTSAVVMDVDRYSTGRNLHYEVFVRYTVDGLEFESTTDDYTFGMRTGNTVKIYYDRNHPFHVRVRGLPYETAVLLVAILFLGSIDLLFCRRLIGQIKEERKSKKPKSAAP